MNKHNQTEIAAFTRAATQLCHEKPRLSENEVVERQQELGQQMETIMQHAGAAVVEAGTHRVRSDLTSWLSHEISASSAQLQWFESTDGSLASQLERLSKLQAAVQLLDLALAVHTPWERLQSLLLAVLEHLQRNQSPGLAHFMLQLPAFVRSSSNLLGSLNEKLAESWQLRSHCQAGAQECVLLVSQSEALDALASEDLHAPGSEAVDEPAGKPSQVEDLLNPEYTVYAAIKEECSWSA